jgi:hypothetical protein
MPVFAGKEESELCSLTALISLSPDVEQISAHEKFLLLALASACETAGASDAMRIAKHAIHAVHRLNSRLIPI